jgi:hypothetical protein
MIATGQIKRTIKGEKHHGNLAKETLEMSSIVGVQGEIMIRNFFY